MPGSQVFISVVFLPGEPQAFANSLSPQPSPMPRFMARCWNSPQVARTSAGLPAHVLLQWGSIPVSTNTCTLPWREWVASLPNPTLPTQGSHPALILLPSPV